jgi:hypothetical protein
MSFKRAIIPINSEAWCIHSHCHFSVSVGDALLSLIWIWDAIADIPGFSFEVKMFHHVPLTP